jgi:hypothetical protein
VYLDARRVCIDEGAYMNGAVGVGNFRRPSSKKSTRKRRPTWLVEDVHSSLPATSPLTPKWPPRCSGTVPTTRPLVAGRLLTAISIDIWTDVDGVMTADHAAYCWRKS